MTTPLTEQFAPGTWDNFELPQSELPIEIDRRLQTIAEHIPRFALTGAVGEPVVFFETSDGGSGLHAEYLGHDPQNDENRYIRLTAWLPGGLGFWKDYVGYHRRGKGLDSRMGLKAVNPTDHSELHDCPDRDALRSGLRELHAAYFTNRGLAQVISIYDRLPA